MIFLLASWLSHWLAGWLLAERIAGWLGGWLDAVSGLAGLIYAASVQAALYSLTELAGWLCSRSCCRLLFGGWLAGAMRSLIRCWMAVSMLLQSVASARAENRCQFMGTKFVPFILKRRETYYTRREVDVTNDDIFPTQT